MEHGLPAEPEYVRHVVHEAKLREREAKYKKGKREARAAQKRRESREERDILTEEEERQRREAAAKIVAEEVADILVNKLSKDEVWKIHKVLGDWEVTSTMLRDSICKPIDAAGHSHTDNVTVYPSTPYAHA